MLKIIDINEKRFKDITNRVYGEKTAESTIHPFLENGNEKIFKLFRTDKDTPINVDNKVKKMFLLNERLKNVDYVVKADNIIRYKDRIIGYTMEYKDGDIFTPLTFNKKNSIILLKEMSKKLKELHKLGIVCADIPGNILVDKDKNIFFIDYDNFAIDNLQVDTKSVFLQKYEEKTIEFDERFDYYLFNLFTLSIIKKFYVCCIDFAYKELPNKFKFKNKEINKIVENTFNLKNSNEKTSYNEDLIIDKIPIIYDGEKIKIKKF